MVYCRLMVNLVQFSEEKEKCYKKCNKKNNKLVHFNNKLLGGI